MKVTTFIKMPEESYGEFLDHIRNNYSDSDRLVRGFDSARTYLRHVDYEFNHAFMDWLIPFIIYNYYYFDVVEIVGIDTNLLVANDNVTGFYFLSVSSMDGQTVWYILDHSHYTMYINERFNINVATNDTLEALEKTMLEKADNLESEKAFILNCYYKPLKPFPTSRTSVEQNSESIETSDVAIRFSSAAWFEKIQGISVTLAGVGGIGSWCALLLSRIYPASITLYDGDTVELANMSGQFYSMANIGKSKVLAIYDAVQDYSDYHTVYCVNQMFDGTKSASNVMMCGFDSIDARRMYFTVWKDHVNSMPADERHKCLFVDGRLAAEDFQIYCLTGDSPHAITKYETTLFAPEEAEQTVCSYKQTSFMANLIAGYMVNLFVNFAANLIEENMRELPYLTVYNGETMYFKIANP